MKTLSAVVLSLLSISSSVLARSSVYFVSETSIANVQLQQQSQPEMSFDAFSMVVSHMLGTTSTHPLHMHSQKAAEDVWAQRNNWLPADVDVFDQKLDANLFVVVAGVQRPEAILPAHNPTLFVNVNDPQDFVELAQDTAESMPDVTTHLENDVTASEAWDSFKVQFPEIDTNLFDVNKNADKTFIVEMKQIHDMVKSLKPSHKETEFISVEINGLQSLLDTYGARSQQYKAANLILRDLFEKTMIPDFQQSYAGHGLTTFVMTPGVRRLSKRAEPGSSSGSCFETREACENATESCSGHGSCHAVKDCYSCQCKPSFAGETCQYVDATADFQLLFWTGVFLIILVGGVLLFVYKSGDVGNGGIIMTQSLPKQD
ncbi:hypothetical protein DFQ28_009740 [Apophysomyces sp. BC1034]|nr:hypothetical protein DFQ30_005947 [Apophysomyces sp. BC1015]KAG0182346.1 hypothetical protein DFQ29_004586 [Apophysomyces sp. BC1021]KAG0194533.1 hypothetical protein DFQ28_009740 [Apophysomyces sp. BC1034]